MSMTKTVWLDVTDMEQWSGHMTGVQRVVYECMCRLQKDSSIIAKGFSYDPYRNEVFEVGLSGIVDWVNQATVAPAGPDRTARLKSLARTMYFKAPSSVRTRITPAQKQFAMRSAKRALYVAHRGLHTVRTLRAKATPSQSADRALAVFRADDTVLVLGKIWDSTALVDLMSVRKREVGFKYVQLVHDTIPVTQPQLFGDGLFEPYSQYLFETLASADVVLCNSRNTEKDVHQLAKDLHFPRPNTMVVELGDTGRGDVSPRRPSFVDADELFLFTISTIEARKNHQLLYLTWKLAAERGVKLPRMIIAGNPGWLTENMVYTAQHDPQTRDVLTFHHGVSDAEAKWLFEHCLFTVFPSIYEGWGIPIAESLDMGKVCIPSNAASLPEVAGDLLEYTSPFDPSQLLEIIQKYLSSETRKAKEAEIKRRYKGRTWDEAYRKIVPLL